MPTPPITTCPDGAGSLNNPANPTNLDPGPIGPGTTSSPNPPANPYVPPVLCVGDFNLTNNGDSGYQEAVANENLNISGAPLNVFKLLGVHEQGTLVNTIGAGAALNGSGFVFNALDPVWDSPQTGMAVLTTPAWIGYDFGTVKTSYGQDMNAPPAPAGQQITTIRITQPTPGRRALQVRVERSDGGYNAGATQFTGIGNGTVTGYTPGPQASPGTFMLQAQSSTQFTVMFTGATTVVVGVATVGVRFSSVLGSFTIVAGATPFVTGDLFSMPVALSWYRVDVVNLPDSSAPAQVRIKQSALSRYWRIIPISFSGVATNQPWEVDKLELFDYMSSSLDDVQDMLFLENRDRDYSNASLQIKAAYTPFDSISDLSKFGFQMADMYTFTTTFASMITVLGRPVVVGDVIELPSEMMYDHNLHPVRKFLEVTDTAWAADGFTTSWKPITFRFQATQLIPGQEHRDLLGTVDTQKYVVDDGTFFDGIEQIQTGQLTATEAVNAEAAAAVPQKGTNTREISSGTPDAPGKYDGRGVYVSDGLPPDGQPYGEGYKLPDVAGQVDRAFFRLNYDPALKIASRLYQFSAIKNGWTLVEVDRRRDRNSMRPSQQLMFDQTSTVSLNTKIIP